MVWCEQLVAIIGSRSCMCPRQLKMFGMNRSSSPGLGGGYCVESKEQPWTGYWAINIYLFIAGCVGKPFPQVEVCIAKPNVYTESGYDVLVRGNHRRMVVTPGENKKKSHLMMSILGFFLNKLETTSVELTQHLRKPHNPFSPECKFCWSSMADLQILRT